MRFDDLESRTVLFVLDSPVDMLLNVVYVLYFVSISIGKYLNVNLPCVAMVGSALLTAR